MTIISFLGPAGFCSVIKTELLALRNDDCFEEADQLDFQKIMLKGDSLCAIRRA